MDSSNDLYYFNKCEDWNSAEKFCESISNGGYDSDYILESVIASTKKVLSGQALYEQDGIAYSKEHNNYELLFALFYMYSIENRINLLDFGGALGSNYHRYKKILPEKTDWSIVEQPNYVSYGKEGINSIDFYYTYADCFKEKDIDAVLFSGVLQYLPKPYEMVKNIVQDTNVKYLLIDETSFANGESEEIYIQHTPSYYYGKDAFYPVHLFNREKMIGFLEQLGYEKRFEWLYDGNGDGIPVKCDGGVLQNTKDRGFLMVRK